MTHSATSRILEDIIIELRTKGLAVPENVLNDLKSARVLMKVENADEKGRGETSPKINEYLGSVEAYLVSEAQAKLPPEQIDEWLRRLETASCETCVTEKKVETCFISGVPRDQKWIRVTPLSTLPAEKLKTLAAETNLSVRAENDGHLIVYGHAGAIKEYIKKMTAPAGSTQR